MKLKFALLALCLGLSAWRVNAQDNEPAPPNPPPNPPGDHGAPPPPPPGGRRPPPPIIGALDANHDGVLDADEIANASKALLSLDKNGDGKLTIDELMGMP